MVKISQPEQGGKGESHPVVNDWLRVHPWIYGAADEPNTLGCPGIRHTVAANHQSGPIFDSNN